MHNLQLVACWGDIDIVTKLLDEQIGHPIIPSMPKPTYRADRRD